MIHAASSHHSLKNLDGRLFADANQRAATTFDFQYRHSGRFQRRLIDHLETLLRTETRPELRQPAANALAIMYYTRALVLVELGKAAQARSDFDRALRVKDVKLPPAIGLQCLLFRTVSAVSPAALKEEPKSAAK